MRGGGGEEEGWGREGWEGKGRGRAIPLNENPGYGLGTAYLILADEHERSLELG